MTLILDHLAVAGHTRDEARDHVEQALGVRMQPGGAHARFGTHNHLMGLSDGLYLEAISIDPDAMKPDRPRWFDLDNFAGAPRITNWICATDDLGAETQGTLSAAGESVDLERGTLRWRMAVPATGKLPQNGGFPALIEWIGADHPSQQLNDVGCSLKMLTVRGPDVHLLEDQLPLASGAKVRYENAETDALVAEFSTPHGTRVLE